MNKIVPNDKEYIFQGKVAICQTDLEGNITFVNRKFCEISGYSVDELNKKNINMLKHPDTNPSIYEKMCSTLKGALVYNDMLKIIRKDGSYYWVDIEVTNIVDKQERISGYISISKPSARKNIQYEMN
ncbi:putative PAS/PAC sensor protein [Sulfurimonas denitrificans DSM 1251]|uniref:Putative PAS/PAC sensor protein n=1 Tax=Sulfurimonas denitrificans (strain ATCC 33889 / DSM 1251) TaxID=326298 RepID=Q30TI3_SULDN|nr:PAS domain S-box protein [Sulfurimonas denitrificans]ABB43698.1 putative PAS/PAC sensor protein [Sulfurimonas denitrificans DSM 1251]